MSARAARTLNKTVLYWAEEARASRRYARARAWENALKAAARAPGWLVRHEGLTGTPILVEIVSIGPRGGIRGRKHYKTREPGETRVW